MYLEYKLVMQRTCVQCGHLPDAGEDEGDDGETGHAPHHAHLHVQEPGGEVSPLCRPELQAAIPLIEVGLEFTVCALTDGARIILLNLFF